jgi:hypothetical protein
MLSVNGLNAAASGSVVPAVNIGANVWFAGHAPPWPFASLYEYRRDEQRRSERRDVPW